MKKVQKEDFRIDAFDDPAGVRMPNPNSGTFGDFSIKKKLLTLMTKQKLVRLISNIKADSI